MSPSARELHHLPYETLCSEGSMDRVVRGPGHAICRVAAATEVQPRAPTDLAGLVRGDVPARPGPSYIPETWWTRSFTTPELYVVGLTDATCIGGRIRRISGGWHDSGQLMLVEGRYLVDDSFHVRDRQRSLPRDLVTSAGGVLRLASEPRDVREVPGVSFLVGSTYGHFGHFLLEGLSRLWALKYVRAADTFQFVVYESEVADWQRALMRAVGIDTDRIVHVTEPTHFERLIVPARAFNLHQASSPEHDRTWATIGDSFETGGTSSRCIYLSRSRFAKNRALINEEEVERALAKRGFDIVHPQELSIDEQIAMIRGADRIAGNSGSAMYLAAFQKAGGELLVVAPRRFVFRDDQLISHHRGTRLAYLMGDTAQDQADAPPRKAAWSVGPTHLQVALRTWLEVERSGDLRVEGAPPSVTPVCDHGPPPIFVGGTGRSGTTILGRALGAHRDYVLIPVEAKFHSDPSGIPGFLAERFTAEDLVTHLREEWAPAGTSLRGLPSVVDHAFLLRSLDGFVRGAKGDPLAAARGLVARVFGQYARSQEKPGWVEMTPRNVVAASALHRLFPSMKLVHVLRDGRDVVASLLNLGWKEDPFAALQWWERRVDQCFTATQSLPDHCHLVLAFDELIGQRRDEALERLFGFLGWSSPVEVLAFMDEHVRPEFAHRGRWRRDFDDHLQERLAAEYEGALTRLGSKWGTSVIALGPGRTGAG